MHHYAGHFLVRAQNQQYLCWDLIYSVAKCNFSFLMSIFRFLYIMFVMLFPVRQTCEAFMDLHYFILGQMCHICY
jgi:hypothetical protein